MGITFTFLSPVDIFLASFSRVLLLGLLFENARMIPGMEWNGTVRKCDGSEAEVAMETTSVLMMGDDGASSGKDSKG